MEFTHFDEQGNARMVDVGDKADTKREAVARGTIFMSPQCLDMVSRGTMAKGDVLGVARVAGIMGAKRTSAVCTARTTGKTGVEMEALTGATVALLTIYDMCKAVDKSMEIGNVYLERKSGGKSGDFHNPRHNGE